MIAPKAVGVAALTTAAVIGLVGCGGHPGMETRGPYPYDTTAADYQHGGVAAQIDPYGLARNDAFEPVNTLAYWEIYRKVYTDPKVNLLNAGTVADSVTAMLTQEERNLLHLDEDKVTAIKKHGVTQEFLMQELLGIHDAQKYIGYVLTQMLAQGNARIAFATDDERPDLLGAYRRRIMAASDGVRQAAWRAGDALAKGQPGITRKSDSLVYPHGPNAQLVYPRYTFDMQEDLTSSDMMEIPPAPSAEKVNLKDWAVGDD